jgi:YidC/Oxa1 family membrane protein insertase
MHLYVLLAGGTAIGKIFQPIYKLFGWVLAFYYDNVWHNYAVAIALLTITVMLITFPLTRASTRSMYKMQVLQPQIKALQQRYKAPRDATAAEKRELNQKMQQEMMALYRENNTSMTGGCLPYIVIFPMLFILYGVVRGMAYIQPATKTTPAMPAPRYIPHDSLMYHNIVAAKGQLISFGINLEDSVRSHQATFAGRLPYLALVLVAIGLQYISLRQISGRNVAMQQANPQMQTMQKVMPLVMAVLYISIPAGVNVYIIVSSLFRIGQQEWMFRRDPEIKVAMAKLVERKKTAPPTAPAPGFFKGLREAVQPGPSLAAGAAANGQTKKGSQQQRQKTASDDGGGGTARSSQQSSAGNGSSGSSGTQSKKTTSGQQRAKSNGASKNAPDSSSAGQSDTRSSNRSQAKRARRPR